MIAIEPAVLAASMPRLHRFFAVHFGISTERLVSWLVVATKVMQRGFFKHPQTLQLKNSRFATVKPLMTAHDILHVAVIC